jgi:hypothetical protein
LTPISRSNVSSPSTLDAVVPANVFTLDKADEQTFLKDWQDDAAFMKQATRIHSDSASPRTRRKPHLFELRGLGVDRCFPGRIHEP